MSTIPKEIQDEIDAEGELRYPVKRHNNPSDSPYVHSQITFRHGVQYGYQLATDGREELEKENWMKENPPFAGPYKKEKKFYIDEVGELLRKYKSGELSISKITELLNEKL